MLNGSIRWRLQIWLGILLVGLLGAFGATSWQLERTQRVRRLDDQLAELASALGVGIRGGSDPSMPRLMPPPDERDIESGWRDGGLRRRPPPGDREGGAEGAGVEGSREGGRDRPPVPPWLPWPPIPPSGDRIPASVKAMFPGDGEEGYYYSVWTGRSARQRTSPNAPADLPMPDPEGRDTQTRFRDRGRFREAYHFTELGECVLAGRPVESDLAGMEPFAIRLTLTGLGVLALGLGGGWWLTARSIRPIEQISGAARRISEGNLSERIPLEHPGSELGQLAHVLNSTFSKLEDSFAQQKRFTADASHELRTPLAVLIAETQSALSRERSAEDYREALAGNLDTARQMKRLAEALLELARIDAGEEPAQGITVDLAELATEILSHLAPLAVKRGTTLSSTGISARVSGSPERFALVLSNLVENAIHHGNPGGNVVVDTGMVAGRAWCSVTDDGPGIAAADLPHLFERFYRADRSRTGAGGRYGLGLAICRGLVEAERGNVSVESKAGEGSTFTVVLPAVDS